MRSEVLHQSAWALHGARTALIIRREVRDSLRDWRILGPIFVLTAIFPWLMSFASQVAAKFAVDYGVADNAATILQQLVPFSLLIVGFFPISFSLVIALETFVGERERNTLEPLLATPITDQELYFGKLVAAISIPLAASYLGLFLHLGSLVLTTTYRIPVEALIQVLILTTLEAMVMVAGAVVVSSHTTSVRAANLLASFIIIPVALLIQAEAVLLFWERYPSLWMLILLLVVVTVILVRTGTRIFNREEILAREFDTLNLRGAWQNIIKMWSTSPSSVPGSYPKTSPSLPSLAALYREHIPAIIAKNRIALALSILVMLSGIFLGWWIAQAYPLPQGKIVLNGFLTSRFTSEWPELTILPSAASWWIFFHNGRALLVMAGLALFSFGAAPLLLVLPTMGIIGFFAGQAANLGYNPLMVLATFVLPHGLFELPAAWLAIGFALQIGLALMSPAKGQTVGQGVLLASVNFAKVFLVVVLPLLLIASVVETGITPQIVANFLKISGQ
ncbi:MAG: stage II sporulation protein M [Chloroflexi bacterium]|nr:stage II sporulation protein M [Chloroflexota bacterium]